MFAIVIIVVMLGAGWLYWMAKRERAAKLTEEWEAVVVEKIPAADVNQTRQYVSVTFGNGQRAFVEVSAALWKTLKAGDRLVKRTGEYEPQREEGTSSNSD